MRPVLAPCFAVLALVYGAAPPAQAHVTLVQPHAAAGSFYVATFQIGHGCEGSATTALEVDTPPGVIVAKPQPKPGWTYEIRRTPLEVPAPGEGGKALTSRVSAIVWRGRLPDEAFDTFSMLVKLPPEPGVLYFPAIQTCERGQALWTEMPAGDGAHLKRPAPALTLTPADGADAMAGMHHP